MSTSPVPARRPNVYRPLGPDGNEIRVLMLEPGKGTDPVIAPLSTRRFHTLGATTLRTRIISVYGEQFPVTVNLASALASLRSSSEALTIWADAVCIDQENIPEVNRTVARMKTIYEYAQEVVVWLGEEQRGDAGAIEFMKDLQKNWRSDVWWSRTLQSSNIEEKVIGVHDILTREYWSRAWVVQETMFNKNITIYCGRSSIPWQTLDFSKVTEKRFADLAKLPGASSKGVLRLLRNSGAGSPGDPGVGGIPNVSHLLRTFIWYRQLNSTNPKDKVYAFIGLLDCTCPPYPVDYGPSVQQVYIDAVKYLVSTTKCLDVIGTTQALPNTLELPSWVPDWRRQPDSSSVNLLRLRQEDPAFSASGSTQPQYKFLDSDRVLSVQGYRVGVLQHLGVPCLVESMTQDIKHKEASLDAFADWYRLLVHHKGVDTQSLIDFCRVLSCDYACSSNGSGRLNISPQLIAQTTIAASLQVAEEIGRLHALPEDLLRLSKDDLWRVSRDSARSVSASFMQDRRFFVSSDGMIGLAPKHASECDLVCILTGCSHPIIVRPIDNYFVVIGESFVHGLMYGEWLVGRHLQTEDLQIFDLH